MNIPTRMGAKLIVVGPTETERIEISSQPYVKLWSEGPIDAGVGQVAYVTLLEKKQ